MGKIILATTVKGWHLDVPYESLCREFYYNYSTQCWEPVTEEIEYSEELWEENNLWKVRVEDLIENLLQYLPNWKSMNDYGGIYVEYEVSDLECGTSLHQLRRMLEWVSDQCLLESFKGGGDPYSYKATDNWGNQVTRWRVPGLPQPDKHFLIKREHIRDIDYI